MWYGGGESTLFLVLTGLLDKWHELRLPTLVRTDFKSNELTIDSNGYLFQIYLYIHFNTLIHTSRVPVSLSVPERTQV